MHFLERLVELIDYELLREVEQGILTRRIVLALAKLYGLREEVTSE